MNEINLDLEYIKQQQIFFAVPCYGGQITEATFMSFIRWSQTAHSLGLNWKIETLTNESLITRGRNTLTARFLSDPETTHLMFVDADIGWEPWQVLLLLHHQRDTKYNITCGLYPMKSIPLQWVVNGVAGGVQESNGLVEVATAGTGFMMLRRSVFDELAKHPDIHQYNNDLGLDPALDQHMRNYWDTAIVNGRYLSEDWCACLRYRSVGGRVWVDPRIQLSHSGSYVFSKPNLDRVVERLTSVDQTQSEKE